MTQQREQGTRWGSHLRERKSVSNCNAGDREEEEVEGESEGSSQDFWELLLTINKRREMDVWAWAYYRAEAARWCWKGSLGCG